ncbi:MAG: AgmX/PglI C-terminal domain-containing protein [Sandaracinaceae bacterium]|nr:AgmX/PglI C-terminal domain-containing protein [Sandaracinaceae bacterium]
MGTAVTRGAEAATNDRGRALREANQRLLEALTDPAADTLERIRDAPPHQQDGLGQLRPGATGKPVIYLHVPSGAPPVDVTLSLALSATRLLEHWPPATATEAALTWNVHAESGPCASPAAAPTPADAACRDVRDGFCEAAEIPRYHGDDDTCLTVGGQQTPLLFYRGEGTDGSTMPLALRPRAAPADGSQASVDPGWEVVRQTDVGVDGIVMLVLRSDGQPSIHLLEGPDYAMPNDGMAPTLPETARAMLHDEAVRRGLTEAEADAFVDAWAPAYFGEATRQGPVAAGRAPVALAEADRALLYFAPEAVVDAALPLTLSPAPTVRHRVFLVRFVDAASRVDRELAGAPGDRAPRMGQVGVGGGPMPGMRHPAGAPDRVRLGAPTVQGPLDSAIVRRVVTRNQAQILHCYEQLLNRQPEASGRVVVAFLITPSGSVASASVSENATGDATLASCMANAVRRWSYPAAEAVTAVHFPFHLTLRD